VWLIFFLLRFFRSLAGFEFLLFSCARVSRMKPSRASAPLIVAGFPPHRSAVAFSIFFRNLAA
jgi:hypothetical protein